MNLLVKHSSYVFTVRASDVTKIGEEVWRRAEEDAAVQDEEPEQKLVEKRTWGEENVRSPAGQEAEEDGLEDNAAQEIADPISGAGNWNIQSIDAESAFLQGDKIDRKTTS